MSTSTVSSTTAPPTTRSPAAPSARLTALDASFLYLERKEAPMHIGAFAVLDGELPFDAYLRTIAAKLERLPRFAERIVSAPLLLGHPTWERDPDFDLRRHVLLHRLPAPGGERELRAKVDELIAGMLDRQQPLWELHVLHGLTGGRSALVSKVHHCMVDGVGGNAILTTLFDLDREASRAAPAASDPAASEPSASVAGAGERAAAAIWDNARQTIEAVTEFQRALFELARGFDREQAQATLDLLRQNLPGLALPPRPLPFNRRCGGGRHLATTRLSFAEARAIRGALGGTVNDVVLACLAGALGRYCEHHGISPDGRTARVMVPVNVRPEGQHAALGNLVSILPVDLPLGAGEPEHRVGAVREVTRLLKRGLLAEGVSMFMGLLGTVPPSLQATLGAVAGSPFPIFNLVCTNVPGPQIPLYAEGMRLREYYPVVPVGFNMGVCCAIYSYNQELFVAFNSDTEACPDADLLRDFFDETVAETKVAAGVDAIAAVEVGDNPAAAAPRPGRRARRAAR